MCLVLRTKRNKKLIFLFLFNTQFVHDSVQQQKKNKYIYIQYKIMYKRII